MYKSLGTYQCGKLYTSSHRTKGKKRSPDTDDYEKQRLATLKRLKRGEVDLRLEKVVAKNKTGSFSEKLATMLIIQT